MFIHFTSVCELHLRVCLLGPLVLFSFSLLQGPLTGVALPKNRAQKASGHAVLTSHT